MPEMSAVSTKVNSIGAMFSEPVFVQQLKLALPRAGVTAERLARIAFTEVRRNPKLASCTRESLMGSLMVCAQYGLEPGPAGFAWLIPYGEDCTFVLGYRGLCQLLWRSKDVAWINCQVVHEKDLFDYSLGAPPRIEFKPSDDDERGKVTHVFAAIGTTSGGIVCQVWPHAKVEKHRKRFSKAGSGSPWETDWDPMAMKTLLIQASKFAPLSLEASAAITLDEKADQGIPQEIDVTPPKEEEPETDEHGNPIPDDVGREPKQGEL